MFSFVGAFSFLVLIKTSSKEENIALYLELRKITREAILANPLLDFDSVLFVSRAVLNDRAPIDRSAPQN